MEDEMRGKARAAMRMILEAAGYEVEEVDEPLDLSAVKGEECLLVLCSDDEHEIRQFDQTKYNLMVNEKEMGCRKLLFSPDDSIGVDNCIVWGVKDFVRYAGEATLAGILNRELSLTFASPTDKKTGKPEQEPEESSSGISIPHLPVKVNKQAAERISGVQGPGKLRFMPHWAYHYKSSGEQVYKDHRIPFDDEGWGAINAINGVKTGIDANLIDNGEIPADAEVMPPRITKEDASEKIYNDLVERLTQHVRIKQEKGDAIYYEEKVMKPDRKNITLEINEVHVPVWQIRGKKIIEVNAFTGEVLSEPMDEGVEIL